MNPHHDELQEAYDELDSAKMAILAMSDILDDAIRDAKAALDKLGHVLNEMEKEGD